MLHYMQCRQCRRFITLRGEHDCVPLACAWCGHRFQPLSAGRGVPGQTPSELLSVADRLRNEVCRVCGCVLSFRQAIRKTCDDPNCRTAYRGIELRDGVEKRRRLLRYAVLVRAKARRWFRVAKGQRPLGVGREWKTPGILAVLLLPANTRPLADLPESRKLDFIHELETLMGRMKEAGAPEADGGRQDEPGCCGEGPSEPRPWEQSCAICGGRCCQSAGTHAYLRDAQIARYLQSHRGIQFGDVVRAFASYLPATSFEGSCVYQGAHGCTLPLRMRSSVCLSFYCEEYNQVRDWFQANARVPVLLAAVDGGKIHHLELFDGRQLHAIRLPSRPQSSS